MVVGTTTEEAQARSRAVIEQVVERPGPELDAALDAAAACFARQGLVHTSVPDIARELGVSKATVYRQVGSVDDFGRLLLGRELHRLADLLAGALEADSAADAVVGLAVTLTRFVGEHPLARKVLTHEPHLLGEHVALLPSTLPLGVAMLLPFVEQAAASAEAWPSSPEVVTELIERLAVVAVLAPPADLPEHFRSALLPHVEP